MGFKIKNSVLIEYTKEKDITSVTIPDGVTSIGEFAFCNCSSLKSVAIPETLTDIAEDAFDSCPSDLKIIKRKVDSE